MNPTISRLKPRSMILCLVLALALLALPGAAGAAEVTVHYTKESLPAFEHQLSSGQVTAVTFNKRLRSMRITLKNGQHVLALYPKHQSGAEAAKIEARHVPVTILTSTQAKAELPKTHTAHKLRYIAGGALILVIVIVGAVLYLNRKRKGSRD